MNNKLKEMKKGYLSKQIGGDSNCFNNNFYTNIDLEHVKCFTFFYLMSVTKLITQLENDIEKIEYYRDHLIDYKRQRNFKRQTKRINLINDKYFKDVEMKEIEFSNLFKEIEEVKELENKFNKIYNGEDLKDKQEANIQNNDSQENEDIMISNNEESNAKDEISLNSEKNSIESEEEVKQKKRIL